MIKSWTLENFKSVSKRTTLELAPLTIFAGANSSGKSTFLQSILLTTQTLQSTVDTRAAVLNGHTIRLGSYDDVASDGRKDQPITIGFQLRPREILTYRHNVSNSSPDIISCEYSFAAKGNDEAEILQLQPQLKSSSISVDYEYERGSGRRARVEKVTRSISFFQDSSPMEQVLDSMGISAGERLKTSPRDIEFRISDYSRSSWDYPSMSSYADAVAVNVMHFLPGYIISKSDLKEFRTETLLFQMRDPGYMSYSFRKITPEDKNFIEGAISSNRKLQNVVMLALESLLKKYPTKERSERQEKQASRVTAAIKELRKDFSLEVFRKVINKLYAEQQYSFYRAMKDRTFHIKDALFENAEPEWTLSSFPISPDLRESVDYCVRYFSKSVKYLGPLRDDPKPVYPITGAIDTQDVGLRGEHTAAVLEIHRKTKVTYIPSSCFSENASNYEPREAPLLDAVLDWLAYMGVAVNVKTADRGKLGHELKIASKESDELHDLIHVGVGVSQVLPILVSSLLAGGESTLIFEQPELHLHPRVQSRLADFFVAMSFLNRQCIIETHSEYLINRLRYRSAISDGDQVSQNTLMYFVEKKNGQSEYRKIKMNRFGVLDEWPDGFFDENDKNASAILKVALEKRKAEARRANEQPLS